MKINYNLIEVKPFGVCFNFATKTFHTESIGEEEIGNVSPRTYVSYTYKEGIVPAPKIFIDSLQNSFPEHDVLQRFLQKWYQLALKDCFPQKAKKLCCVGEADSGKTSWFAPYEGIISREKLASVTRDRHFSASMLSDDTECLIVDEWPPDALSADDAKRILQGGYVALPQKHKEATHVVYRSGVYITCNSIPSFTEIDDAAIQTRLAVFKTRSLKERNPQATNYLRKNCMQCFHWCANELRDTPLWEVEEIERAEQQHDDEGAIFNDFNEGQSSRMINIEEIEKLQFSQSIIIANDEATAEHPQGAVPTEIIDQVILDDEDENPNWVREESRCFVTFGPINVFSYHKAVFLLITSKPNWDLLDATDEDLERFQRRRRLSWKKPDSMYDAWLLIEGTPRPEFDIKLFSETFPRWEELLRETYRGISQLSTPINESIDSNNDKTASDDESFFKTQKTPKKRPRTMIVQRRRKHLKLSSDEEE
ncbi:uncharacterized protein LOC135692361 [Rhopilema esculentum]|uniref:uncharacterized protein LOC135692361 n=1 Tax=Rhopilema esculentum TaxID=499914 RepID=UPI0031CF4442